MKSPPLDFEGRGTAEDGGGAIFLSRTPLYH